MLWEGVAPSAQARGDVYRSPEEWEARPFKPSILECARYCKTREGGLGIRAAAHAGFGRAGALGMSFNGIGAAAGSERPERNTTPASKLLEWQAVR